MRVRIIEPTKPLIQKRKKVCAYARVSSASEAQGDSLENQTTYYRNLIEGNPEYEYVGIFADYGLTGTTGDRPEFQRMLALAEQNKAGAGFNGMASTVGLNGRAAQKGIVTPIGENKIDRILTKSISRFARNTTIVLEVVRKLKDLGVEVIFEKENISSFDGDGELMLTVLSSFAQEESKNVSDNQKWRYRRKFEEGKVAINTTRFWGYDKDQYGDLVINRTQAEIVERIFSDCINGKGTFTIAKELQQEGIPTITGGNWTPSTVLHILKNEKYKGDAILQKTYIKDHLSKKKCTNRGEVDSYYIEDNHSPVVTKEVWDEAQRQISLRVKGNIDKQQYQNRYPLSGMLFCSKCGKVLMRRTWNSKFGCKKIVWQCSTYINEGKKSCSGTSIEDVVVGRMNIQDKTIITETKETAINRTMTKAIMQNGTMQKETVKHGQKHYSYTSKG